MDQSLQLGTAFLLESQLAAGNFRYHVSLETGQTAPEQSAVRQAGALWGLALIHHDHPSAATRQAVLRGAAFYERHSALSVSGGRYIRYPGAAEGDSGAVALVALALIDFLRAEPPEQHPALRKQVSEYVAFLRSLRRADHHFFRKYLLSSGEGWGQPSPYFDGEVLLALVKAARYGHAEHLKQACMESAEAMYQAYVRSSVTERRDDDETKGFFQWGCMALHEMWGANWASSPECVPRTISLAHWMIDVHEMLERRRNTAYALEGIIVAYHMAHETDDQAAADKFRRVIQQVLARLTSWQVGGPMPCPYLRSQRDFAASCLGGILGADHNPWLRIDTTQHQMHAVILARRYVWTRDADSASGEE